MQLLSASTRLKAGQLGAIDLSDDLDESLQGRPHHFYRTAEQAVEAHPQRALHELAQFLGLDYAKIEKRMKVYDEKQMQERDMKQQEANLKLGQREETD